MDLYAVSAQNEPDFTASYQSCLFNASQMVSFIKVLGPMLAALNPPVKVLAAEPDNWGNIWGGDNYGPAIIRRRDGQLVRRSARDARLRRHQRRDVRASGAALQQHAPRLGDRVHAGRHGADHHRDHDLRGVLDGRGQRLALLVDAGSWCPNASSPPPQVYALGNFSKFVRPGYYRVDVSGAPKPSSSAPLVVAFTNLQDATVAIVVVNGGGAQNVSFFVAGTAWPASVTPYVTTDELQARGRYAHHGLGARFSASLAAQSVTTFVGKP